VIGVQADVDSHSEIVEKVWRSSLCNFEQEYLW
jgi:hypothetical protein